MRAGRAARNGNDANFTTRYADFDAVFDAADRDGVEIPESLYNEILKTSNPKDIGYFLAKNPELREQLASESLTPAAVAKRVAQISQDLSGLHKSAQQSVQHSNPVDLPTDEAAGRVMEKLTGQMIGNVQRGGGMAPHVIQTIRKETGNPEAVFVHLA